MALDGRSPYLTPAFRVGAAALGSFIAGPLGCATGAFLGGMLGDIFGKSAAELVATCAEKFGEAAAEKLLGAQLDSLAERFHEGKLPQVETVYREAFREALVQVHSKVGQQYEDWFENWDRCLKSTEPLELESLVPAQIVPDALQPLLRHTLQSLDRQGRELRSKSLSIRAGDGRSLEPELLAEIEQNFPEHFKSHFRVLIVRDEYKQAWKETELNIRQYFVGLLERIDENTSETRKMVEFLYQKAQQDGKIATQTQQAKEEEIARLTKELQELKDKLAARPTEPANADLSKALDAGDLDGALRLKSKQVEQRRAESKKLPRDLYELGTIYELRFEWGNALQCFGEAWKIGGQFAHGFSYARFAQKLNHFEEAITAYQSLLVSIKVPAIRAGILNNLGQALTRVQRLKEAEAAYTEALGIARGLSETRPDDSRVHQAMILSNLASILRRTKRVQEAEQAWTEAISMYRQLAELNPDKYLPLVASTARDLGVLFSETHRNQAAEQAYAEALGLQREFAAADPGLYLPGLASTLNSLANHMTDNQRTKEAEAAYVECIGIRRKLVKVNEEAYLPSLARALSNFVDLLSTTQRMTEAELICLEALAINRKLAARNPDAYLPGLAANLNNLAVLYDRAKLPDQAVPVYAEALTAYRKLSAINPDAYLLELAMTLNNLAALQQQTGKMEEAEAHATEAERIVEPLWRANPVPFGDALAEILGTRVAIAEAKHEIAEACALARRALGAAYDLALVQAAQADIDRLCPSSSG